MNEPWVEDDGWQWPPEDGVRRARYAEYRALYAGEQWQGRPRPGEKRLTVNYCRAFINKVASYLMGKAPRVHIEGASATSEEGLGLLVVERYLEEVATFNNLAAVDLDTAISAATLGDGAYTVRWDETARLPRVTAVDPAGLRCRWRADDLHTLLWVEQRYRAYPQELAPYAGSGDPAPDDVPLLVREEWTPDTWRLYIGGALADGGANPYKRIPYVVFPNLRQPGEFWGQSDLVDLIGLQRDINSRFSVLTRILEVSGNPIAVVENVTDSSGLQVGPGQLWELPEGARAYLLDLLQGGGVRLHIDYLNLLYRAMHDLAELPRTAFGDGSGTTKSGVALEVELQPLLHKLARKRLTWTTALEERARLMLAVAAAHGSGWPAVRLGVDWPAVLPQDRDALVGQETALVGAGIHSHQRAMAVLGEDDPAAEWQRVREEQGNG